MTHLTRAKAAAAALLAVAALLTAGPARAATREARADTWLYLTVTKGNARAGIPRGALLRCDPPRWHARAAEACAELADVGGDIGRIPAENVFCPMIYAPVTTRALGRWNGKAVDFRETYTSACVMRARTRHVFALDG
ncbi:SSI family serine proteinase inhibitor [Streptomyces sp. SCL15-4]|uniref:SSI family serine proteinase inhibitor n=1 Tax=Streptomyces sp. SCL15-4 TaxID=2967221 RepID=UPI002965CFDD|nr:SSI family serine proteinase inhibitor [Streptomyces sp. SCL15-4]